MKFISFLVILVISLYLSESSPVQDTKCSNFCEYDYSPLCATDDEGKTRTFSNLCVMKSENCLRSTSFQKTAEGACP